MKKDFCLFLSYENKCIDYYTDVFIDLVIGAKKINIFKDNFWELNNIVVACNKGIKEMNDSFDETKLGVELNEYYKRFYKQNLKSDEKEWEGEKFCIYTGIHTATWLYKYKEEYIFKITPIYNKFEEDDDKMFYDFINNCSDIFKCNLSKDDLQEISEMIIGLFKKEFAL